MPQDQDKEEKYKSDRPPTIFTHVRDFIAKGLILIVICSTGIMKLGTTQQQQRDISSIFNTASEMPGSPRITTSGGGSSGGGSSSGGSGSGGGSGGGQDGGDSGPNNDINRRPRKETGDLAATEEEAEDAA